MKKIYILGILLGFLFEKHIILSAAGGNIPVTTVFCGNGNNQTNINCQFGTINAVGDEIKFSTDSKLYPSTFEPYTITMSQSLSFKIPQQVNSSAGFELTFINQGKKRVAQCIIILQSELNDTGAPIYVYKFYTNDIVDSKKKNNVWSELGRLTTPNIIVDRIDVFVSVDGIISFQDPSLNRINSMDIFLKRR